jgi:hypothetical protein
VDPRAGLDDVKKRKFLNLPGLELRPLGRPASSLTLYRLRYPGPLHSHGMLVPSLRARTTVPKDISSRDIYFCTEHRSRVNIQCVYILPPTGLRSLRHREVCEPS